MGLLPLPVGQSPPPLPLHANQQPPGFNIINTLACFTSTKFRGYNHRRMMLTPCARKWRLPHERPRCLCLCRLVLHHHSGPNRHLIHPRTGRQRTPNTRLIHQAPAFPGSPSPPSSHWYRAFPCSKYACLELLLLQCSHPHQLRRHLLMNQNVCPLTGHSHDWHLRRRSLCLEASL
jgi:hypothetical protein